MDRVIELLIKFVKYLIDKLEAKGAKAVLSIIYIIILGIFFLLISASPLISFIFFYKRSIFQECNILANVGIIFSLDSVLFLTLFIFCLIRDIDVNIETGELTEGKCNKSVAFTRTILLMAWITIVLTIVYGICVIMKIDTSITLGAISLLCILIITLFRYIGHYIKIKCISFILISSDKIRRKI